MVTERISYSVDMDNNGIVNATPRNVFKKASGVARVLGACALLSQAKLPAVPLDVSLAPMAASTQSQGISESHMGSTTSSPSTNQLVGIGLVLIGTAINCYSIEKRSRGNLPGTASLMAGGYLVGSGPLVFSTLAAAAGALAIGYVIGTGIANRE